MTRCSAYYGLTFDELLKLTGAWHDNGQKDTEAQD